jgi:hypothetical protein
MSRIRFIEHDEYAAWCGDCRCSHCRPFKVSDPEPDDERDDAIEWAGVE